MTRVHENFYLGLHEISAWHYLLCHAQGYRSWSFIRTSPDSLPFQGRQLHITLPNGAKHSLCLLTDSKSKRLCFKNSLGKRLPFHPFATLWRWQADFFSEARARLFDNVGDKAVTINKKTNVNLTKKATRVYTILHTPGQFHWHSWAQWECSRQHPWPCKPNQAFANWKQTQVDKNYWIDTCLDLIIRIELPSNTVNDCILYESEGYSGLQTLIS